MIPQRAGEGIDLVLRCRRLGEGQGRCGEKSCAKQETTQHFRHLVPRSCSVITGKVTQCHSLVNAQEQASVISL